ncbi:hypothetical protein K402DRAFT_60439 [Aulographum hederae CBS 113979]|uniref:Homeobox domain-containing protein n=1 Tax=Aulographum hederae CBS 113979 TaxID=1176131 RepID=A0A6G1H1T9_9PEZI|nr:hypothetical protein K402DRAFT_60439 [Aulographum hederae CBS 113979]
MVDPNLFIPLSPPTSPRMSAYHTSSVETEWHDQSKNLETTSDPETNMAMVHGEMPGLDLDMQRRPMLRSHKTFPYPLRTSGCGVNQPDTPLPSSGTSPTPHVEGLGIGNLEDVQSSDMATVTFGGSAPASPISNQHPISPDTDGPNDDNQDLNGLDLDGEDDDLGDEEPSKPMTAAELRAQKRKMKRFRLTHNQTRFLMSEFARQAHPDAAHRERLAREIPGLSPRQVQVWFQNRRAKLKRLTSDDRERMMRSRALPDDFDMTQALHSPFGATHGLGTPLTSPSSYTPAFPEGNMIRPLNIDTLRRVPDGSHISPGVMTPFSGGFNFTPPQSVTDTLSPVSNHGDNSPAFNFSPNPMNGDRRGNPFGNVGSTPSYTSHPNIPRLQIHDRMQRTRSESLSSPLRTSMSYSGGSDMTGTADPSLQPLHSAPIGGEHQGENGQNNMMPYGLGYNYNQVQGFQSSSNSRMRSFSGGVPRRIELSNQYQPQSQRSNNNGNPGNATPRTATFPNYSSSPMASQQSFSMMSAPHHITSFSNSYIRQDGNEHFPNVGSVVGEVEDSGSDGNEHNEGLSSSY